MKKAIFLIMILTIGYLQGYAQKLPADLIKSISNAITPKFTAHADSVDIYTVALVLSADGKRQSLTFSAGTPASVKDDIVRRLNAAYVHLTPLDTYWKEYCKKNDIRNNTCFIQPVLVRFEETDKRIFTVDQVSDKVTAALTFEDMYLGVKENMKIVWLPAKTSRILRERVVQ
ncbi:hypothetical protein EGT74_06655 [Chitinophaga lutea]|uniref:Uncharacterized protein n=1 Tax=Chitinophaga lutea TaxID=2488634 RepID=A0A3N4PZ98_9BACT|nr:hypothetical protein [Chitinophaga lutea]RPE13206.1 hypothetical protein EGT74_06655 [Chitinophaga lutea]